MLIIKFDLESCNFHRLGHFHSHERKMKTFTELCYYYFQKSNQNTMQIRIIISRFKGIKYFHLGAFNETRIITLAISDKGVKEMCIVLAFL